MIAIRRVNPSNMLSFWVLFARLYRVWKEWYEQQTQQKRGQFIVIEGVDGIGTSTLARQLVDLFNRERIEERAVLWSFPRKNSSTGRIIDDYFKGNLPRLNQLELHFLFVRNRMEALAEIEALLDAGKVIVCNRFWMSGAAYSIARGLGDVEWCTANEPEEVKRIPDVTVLLDGIDVALKAEVRHKEEKEVTEKECFMMRRIARNYNELFAKVKYPGKYIKIELIGHGDIHRNVFDMINKI